MKSALRTFCRRYRLPPVIAAILLFFLPAYLPGQNNRYGVPNMQMYVTVQPDGSAIVDYAITYHNQPQSSPKEVVDIGTPNARYDLRNVKAWIGDRQIPPEDIRRSTVLPTGFEVHFGGSAIAPGATDVLRVQFTARDMVFGDSTRGDYASFRITPTWFNPNFVEGNTHLQIAVQLPQWVKPEEALSQKLPFSARAKTKQGTVVYWDFPATPMTEEHFVAVSFPKGGMRVYRPSPFELLYDWFSNSNEARWTCGVVFLILFAILFFRFSGGTGFSVFLILSAAACVLFCVSPGAHLASLPLVVVLIGLNEWFLAKRKTKYMPPIAQIEGGGIKRGLTAPEAAVLLELPLSKVLSLVIFGMLKKGILRQVQASPLTVELNDAFVPPAATVAAQGREGEAPAEPSAIPAPSAARQEPRPPEPRPPVLAEVAASDEPERRYREAVQKMGSVMQKYEAAFLFLIHHNSGKPVSELDFAVPMRGLIEGTAAKMKGFDLRQTKEYYQSIVRRATEQAAAIGDIPQRTATIDRNFDWILMGDGYPTVFDFGRGYWPPWSRGTVFGGSTVAEAPEAPSIPGTTSFGDVASSFSGWAENTMGSLAGAILPSSLGGGAASGGGGGFLDLSGADHVTGEIFSALAETATSGSGGGGLSGGGGCACAGCACACACAGGGR
jgi:hypothetical protein